MINNCIAMEQAVASIYSSFLQLFPEEKFFWEDLLKDEMQHESWLSEANYVESIDLLPSTDLLPSMKFVENSLSFAENISRHIKANPVTLEYALKISLKLEESMVETFANELIANLFAFDYESLSEKILMAERLHIDKIEDMMIKKGFLKLS